MKRSVAKRLADRKRQIKRRLERPPAYLAAGAPRQRPPRVKRQVIRRREFLHQELKSEQVTKFEYSPTACANSYRMVVVRKNISQEKGEKRLIADVRNRTLSVVRVRVPHFKQADQLLQKHGMTVKLRTPDSLQLGTALDLRARAMLDHFVCKGVNLCNIAAAEGLSVINPEMP